MDTERDRVRVEHEIIMSVDVVKGRGSEPAVIETACGPYHTLRSELHATDKSAKSRVHARS